MNQSSPPPSTPAASQAQRGRPPTTGRFATRAELLEKIWFLNDNTNLSCEAIAHNAGVSATVVAKIIKAQEGRSVEPPISGSAHEQAHEQPKEPLLDQAQGRPRDINAFFSAPDGHGAGDLTRLQVALLEKSRKPNGEPLLIRCPKGMGKLAMNSMDNTSFGQAALKKFGSVPEGFHIFASAWIGKKPEDWVSMRVSGAQFRARRPGGPLDVRVPGTTMMTIVTREEMQQFKPASLPGDIPIDPRSGDGSEVIDEPGEHSIEKPRGG